LRKRGWGNCGLCPLCKQTEENNNHLFVHCRFTVRIWEQLRNWLGILGLHPRKWAGIDVQEWQCSTNRLSLTSRSAQDLRLIAYRPINRFYRSTIYWPAFP
jgi:hypothetical protein